MLLCTTLPWAAGAHANIPYRTDHRTCTGNIANVMPVLLNPRSGMYGQHVAALPLGLALQ